MWSLGIRALKLVLGAALALGSSLALAGQALSSDTACTVPKNFDVSARDLARFNRLELSRSKGLAGALVGKNAQERALVSSLLADGFSPISDVESLAGTFQCRTIKMGGNLPLIAYGWFTCKIFPEEAVMVVHKSTGSQRFFGFMRAAGNGMAYLGASFYGYEDSLRYYGDKEEHNQVGCMSAVGASMNHFVLEIPEPAFESFHNIIEFKRMN